MDMMETMTERRVSTTGRNSEGLRYSQVRARGLASSGEHCPDTVCCLELRDERQESLLRSH